MTLREPVAEIKVSMGIDETIPLAKAVDEAAKQLGLEADGTGGIKTKEKANKVAEELGLPSRSE